MVTDIIKRMEDFMNEMERKWGAMDKEFDKVQFQEDISKRFQTTLYTLKDSLFMQEQIEIEKWKNHGQKQLEG
ncbi:hypothetical protein [Peribacillus butanolivorans]|uniref:hypothetical protein n=1 Tax=Peribacillus butanolivorans TaxID=421767 RepID=UPI00366E46B2